MPESGFCTVLGSGAGVLRLNGLSSFSADLSFRLFTALDTDTARRNVDGVPLSLTTRRGYGLCTLLLTGESLSCIESALPALKWNFPYSSTFGDTLRGLIGDGSPVSAASLSKALVAAENFMTGIAISSSELSFKLYVRVCATAGTESDLCNGGLIGICLYVCLEGGRLESDAKWEEPIGVGEAVAISEAREDKISLECC